jgi:hypothetical protein
LAPTNPEAQHRTNSAERMTFTCSPQSIQICLALSLYRSV